MEGVAEQKVSLGHIDKYDDYTLWDKLIEELAMRDLLETKSEEEIKKWVK